MKLPEKAPKLEDLLKKENKDLFSDELTAILKKLIDDYDYWAEFKRKPLPAAVTPEIAWARRELESLSSRKYLPFADKDGRQFSFWLTPKTQPVLHFIDRGALSFPIADMRGEAEKTKYLLASLMEEAIASSQIEGAATTRRIAKEMLASSKTPKNKSEWMIFNNYKAISRIKEQDYKEPLSEAMLLNLHKILAENTLTETDAVGRFRLPLKDDDISVYDADGNILHTPYPAENVRGEIKKLIEFANQKHDGAENDFIHPVVKAIILHFWFAYIHPFVDGNGRTARALFYWFMLKNGYWIFEYISISKLVLKMSGQYKKAFLYSECSQNDLTYFILFNLDIIEKSIKDVTFLINQKEAQQKKNRFIMEKYPHINSRQRDILINAVKNPDREYKIATHRGLHNIGYATAREDFEGLKNLGLMEKRLIGKTNIFVPVKDIQSKLTEK
ncbi:MAG: Fic family protein [Elusimicrobiota bacterium]|jgi:Fic family protein|nr:Fic family protein [Elusimicrobiota bacterium]